MNALRSRLANCIQTILELEEDIREGVSAGAFDAELEQLQKSLRRVADMPLAEEDVAYFEQGTRQFLEELARTRRNWPQQKYILQ